MSELRQAIRAIATCILGVAVPLGAVRAQQPPRDTVPLPRAQPVFSMGQPSRWQPYAAGSAMFAESVDGAVNFLLGVNRPITNPVTGLLGGAAEAYGTLGGDLAGAGVRFLATSRGLNLAAGADWSMTAGHVDFLLSFRTAVRRGGLFGGGSMLRLDWLPTRDQTFGIGVEVPLGQHFAGRTRPRRTDVRLSTIAYNGSPPPAPRLAPPALNAISAAADAAAIIRAYGNLSARGDVPNRSYAAAAKAYVDNVARAFGAASGKPERGEEIARRARAGLLEHVLLPYDAHFGEVKDDADIRDLSGHARIAFAAWVRDSSRIATEWQNATIAVHERLLGIVERTRDELLARWKDPRLVWLPLQLALTEDQFDDQAEVDSLIERAVGRPFTDGNALTYLRSADLPLEIARSVFATRDYHVLVTHDFAGRRETGSVDNIGYSMVADVYLPALTEAVQRYDSTGRFPVLMILLDQFRYEVSDGRLWMTILADPLDASIRLPRGNEAREAHLRQRQSELRAAVAASRQLQAQAGKSGGASWLRRVVKVNVSITQPSDFSFRSDRTLPPIPFTPDNISRGHRKFALYDLNEADPYRGGLLLMGIGIGEHYSTATWDDRGYRLRGPAALEARAAVRRLLRQNGFTEAQIPESLRPVESPAAAERRMDLNDYVGRALQVHNEVGFGRKQSSVVRAMLYDLAPPGSVVIVPDPLWLSDVWASMLAGAAARGCRVFVVAPAFKNAPSPAAPLMARERELLTDLLILRLRLRDRIREAGGELRVGLYAARAELTDVSGRRREIREGLQRAPWLRALFPFDSVALATLERTTTETAARDEDASDLAHDVRARLPQLHQKTQLVARPGAIAAFLRQPGWETVLTRAMERQSQQTALVAEQIRRVEPQVKDDAMRSTDALLRGYEQGIPEAERRRVTFYFSLGSQNQDPRGMLLDGEMTVVVSGIQAASGVVDLYFVMALSQWIDTEAQLDPLLPRQGAFTRWLSRVVKTAF